MSTILSIQGLSKIYRLEAGLFAASARHVWALNGVSLDVERGETYGLVGESGSGKTTLARTIVQLVEHTDGVIEYYPAPEGDSSDTPQPWRISSHDSHLLREYRSQVKYIFQDPSSSLDPRMSVGGILTAGARYSPRLGGKNHLESRVREVLDSVGLREGDLARRPSEFSGGQRQRISLARALVYDPAVLICDEVVSALDVSIQGQILNLLVDLKQTYRLTIFFIAHDLTVVSYMADRIGVMYGGCLMEEAPSSHLVENPLHPYTKLLYESIPSWNRRLGERAAVLGQPYVPTREPVGCPFAGRCPHAQERCRREMPALRTVATNHKVACHFVDGKP